MRVLVFGSRSLGVRHLDVMVERLEAVAQVALPGKPLVLVHGAGPPGKAPGAIGADMLSEVAAHLAWRGHAWAVRRYPVEPVGAETWAQAARRRNLEMVRSQPDMALCFHTDEGLGRGSRHTARALEEARPAGSRYLLVLMTAAGAVAREEQR